MVVPDVAHPAQIASEKDVRSLLVKRKNFSDASIGRLPFVERIWSCVQAPRTADETQRGRMLRAAIWDLIEQHHEEALNGAEPCSVCAPAEGDDWHVLWLENTFTLKEGFERRYTHEELVALGSYAASEGQIEQIPSQDVSAILELERVGGLQPAEFYPIKKRRELRWYGKKAKRGREAIRAHLTPDDQRLRTALERQGVRFDDAAAAVPSTAATLQKKLPARIGQVVRSHSWLGVLLSVLLLLIVAGGLLVQVIPLPTLFAKAPIQVRSLDEAHIAGFFVARQWTGGSARTLYAIDAHSGAYRPLWPNAAMLQGGPSSSGELGDFLTDSAPVYLPTYHLLAFIAEKGHTPTIWLAHIQIAGDGWPQVVSPGPQELVENCACNVLGWSASGDWLLYDTPTGITAVSPNTAARQQVTSDGQDRWPACSPNGAWLAIQNALHDIAVLPSRDCIPVANATSSERYLNGYRVAWHPAWSMDGTMLAFTSNQGGQDKIYAIPFDRLARNVDLEDTAPAFQVSQGTCTDPIWVTNKGAHEALVAFTCSPQASNPQHGSLIAVPGTTNPSWEGLLDQGTLGRDSICWMPA